MVDVRNRDGGAATTPGAAETWPESLLLLPRRAVFVAVALVQIAVELVMEVLRRGPRDF